MFTNQRQQEIINILLQDQKWHTLEEIAERARCAVKTVRRDLRYLTDQLPPEWNIQVIKGKGVTLYKPPHSTQDSIYSFFKREDMRFRVLDQLLRKPPQTVTQLADALYVQASNVSAVLHNVKSYLRYFNLELRKKPLRIVGIEGHIIYMFCELYFTTYGWEYWPFPNEKEVFSYITKIEQALDIQFYPSNKQRLTYLLAVAIQRKKQGYQMDILPIYEALIIETSFYQKIKAISPTLCGLSLTKMDQIFITIAVNCCMFVHSNRNHYKQEILHHYYDGTSTVYQYAKDLVEQLEKAFDMSFHHDDEFLFYLLQYLRQSSYRNQFIPALTSPSSESLNQAKEKHSIIFQKVHHVYTAWAQQYPFLSQVNERDILAITLQLEAMFQLSQKYRKQVLLYLGDYILWKRYIQGILYHEFGNTLSIVTEEVVDIQKFNLQNIDGILTTIPLKKMPVPILHISVIPTRRELDDIKAFLDTE